MGIRTTRHGPALASHADPVGLAAHRTGHRVAVGALTALVAAGYCVFVLGQYYTFRSSTDDLVIFDQAVRSYAHFKPGTSIMIGYHFGFGPHYKLLGNHFSPILAALAPLYWIFDGPQTLLVAQAVLFALAIPPLWVFTRRAFGGGRKAAAAAYLAAVAYALSWPIASALAFNFHEVAFAPVLMAVALERLQAGRLRSALIALGVLLLVKEDMGLFVAGVGAYLAVCRPLVNRQRLVAAVLVVAGVAYTWIAADVLIPAFGGTANGYWAYDSLGANVPQAAWHLVAHPLSSLRLLVTPSVKLDTMLWLVGAFCFLPLLSPISLAAVPLLLERMLASTFPNWWVTPFQYNAYVVVILLCAAVDGAARLDRWVLARRHLAAGPGKAPDRSAGGQDEAEDVRPSAVTEDVRPLAATEDVGRAGAARGRWTVALACSAAMCAVAVFLVPRFAFWPGLQPSFYHRTPSMRAVAQANALIPSGVTVAALNVNGSQLSGRDTVLIWDGDGGTPPLAAPWVVANVRALQFSFYSVHEQRQRVAFLERNGFKVVFKRRGYVVLHRSGPAPASVPSQRAAG